MDGLREALSMIINKRDIKTLPPEQQEKAYILMAGLITGTHPIIRMGKLSNELLMLNKISCYNDVAGVGVLCIYERPNHVVEFNEFCVFHSICCMLGLSRYVIVTPPGYTFNKFIQGIKYDHIQVGIEEVYKWYISPKAEYEEKIQTFASKMKTTKDLMLYMKIQQPYNVISKYRTTFVTEEDKKIADFVEHEWKQCERKFNPIWVYTIFEVALNWKVSGIDKKMSPELRRTRQVASEKIGSPGPAVLPIVEKGHTLKLLRTRSSMV